MIYLLDERGEYGQAKMFALKDSTPVSVFPDLQIDWAFMAAEQA